MIDKETGGPAFPAPNYICDSARIDKDAFQKMGLTQGMTLRDWFAGQSLGLGEKFFHRYNAKSNEDIAFIAYQFADAMIAVRKGSDGKEKS